jgi:general secretion pathway protein H
MFQISTVEARAGFSLLEMMAVMSIIALVASLVIAATPGTGRAGLKSVTLKTAALFRRERARAVLSGRADEVRLDGARRRLVGDDGDNVVIPEDVVLDLLGADAPWSGQRAVVHFDPDGTSSGAVLRYSREEAGYEIRVNWYTGTVSAAAFQP